MSTRSARTAELRSSVYTDAMIADEASKLGVSPADVVIWNRTVGGVRLRLKGEPMLAKVNDNNGRHLARICSAEKGPAAQSIRAETARGATAAALAELLKLKG